jgi:hypothetical protein
MFGVRDGSKQISTVYGQTMHQLYMIDDRTVLMLIITNVFNYIVIVNYCTIPKSVRHCHNSFNADLTQKTFLSHHGQVSGSGWYPKLIELNKSRQPKEKLRTA